MHVCILSPFFPKHFEKGTRNIHYGGVERYVDNITKELSKIGVKVTVITSSNDSALEKIDNIKFIKCKRWITFYGTPLFRYSNKLLKRGDFDLIHAQATYPFVSDISSKYATKMRIPSIVTYHYDAIGNSLIHRFLIYSYYQSLGRLIKNHDKIIVSTKSYKENSSFLSKISEEKFEYIPMGVNTDRFYPDESLPIEKRILFVGRLIPYKGIFILLHSMKIVQKKIPDYQLAIAGDGPLRHEIEELAKKLQINVEFLGYVPEKKLPNLYNSTKLTVLPSINSQEAFGMTLLESMSCGIPVVASDLPGVREIAKVGGILAKANDSQSLANSMVKTIEKEFNFSERVALHRKIEQQYSWHDIALRTKNLYEKLVG